MKKLFILFALFFMVLGAIAQEIERPSSTTYNTFSKDANKVNYSYWDYDGIATDLLVATTSDTIDIRYQVRKYKPYTLKVMSKFNPIAGADTIVYINVLGRNSTDESWTSIITDSSAVVSADGITKTVSTTSTYTVAAFDVPFTNPTLATADTLEYPVQTYTSTLLEYRYILVRYILGGDDSVGTGVELVRSELKIYEH